MAKIVAVSNTPMAPTGYGTQIAQLGANTQAYTSSNLTSSTVYYYRVQAINGNGPVRISAYKDEGVRKLVPYADDEAAVLQGARSTVPGFENTQKAMDFFMEEVQQAMLGVKTPEQAMADLKKRVEPLLPK